MEHIMGKDYFDPDGPPLCVFRMPLHSYSKNVHTHDFVELRKMMNGWGGDAGRHLGGFRLCSLSYTPSASCRFVCGRCG